MLCLINSYFSWASQLHPRIPRQKKKNVENVCTRLPLQTTYMMIYLKLLSRHKEYKQYLNGYTLSKEFYMLCNWIC